MAVPLPWHCRPLVAVEAVRCHCGTSRAPSAPRGSSPIPWGTVTHWDMVPLWNTAHRALVRKWVLGKRV